MVEQWFATSRFGLDDVPEPTRSIDASLFLVHAKKLGTTGSACGQNTTTWHKHWDSFDSIGFERQCRDCVIAVAEERRQRAVLDTRAEAMS
jgi:hypothetical protein